MTMKRTPEQDEPLENTYAMETARSAAESGAEKGTEKKEEEKLSLFWRVFGGTILSIVALVSINIFNNMSSSITELRAEVSREREARAELVKKEEFNARISNQYERIRGLDGLKVELEGLKEKVHTNAAALDGVKRDAGAAVEVVKKDNAATADAMKKDSATLEVLKEKVKSLELLRKDIANLDVLKEKLTVATAELKLLRDDLNRLSGEVDKNKASDLDRKAIRDAQYKQLEEAMKEVQKALQDCREKLARLEGGKPVIGPPAPGAKQSGEEK